MHTTEPKFSMTNPIGILFLGFCSGISVGVLTNLFNSIVCADYYSFLMRWNGNVIFQAILGQGAIEGGALGFLFGIVIAISSAASTGLRCSATFAFRTLGICILIAVACWMLGGFLGVLLSYVAPSLWNGSFFIAVPPEIDLHQFAWVGGSINGAYLGALIACTVAPIHLHIRWNKTRVPVEGFRVLPIDVTDAHTNPELKLPA